MTVLHSLNHIYKTRDVIIKNNAKLSRADEQTFDFKDQGFTRPKVLIILPTRNSCLQYVQDLILLSDTEQQENRKRFTESFSIESEVISAEKPADFRDLFGGNDDDSFRVGIKFTRKTMKFFSDFYSSDMILASPLGLSLAIHGAHKKKEDYDFLSSIELLVIDHADALIIQNWAHMETILEHINKIPSQSRGCDFSRIKEWYLDGNAKYMRQTIVYSSYLTPELNSLYNLHMLNYEGKIKNKVLYDGSIEDVGLPLVQIFLRFTAPSSQDEADIRFGHFENVILKPFLQSSDHTGTLIFIPSYFDFIRLQNHLESLDASFCSINEYTAPKEISRARSYFQTGQKSIMLYTERSHHFRRLQIRGVKNIAMYGLPDHPNFYPEIVRFLGVSEGKCKILFNKWDAIKLERIVGSRRIRMMCDSSKGDTFEFR
ncbi:U3 small nucleolar RNA-associated protein 25 [Neolecta irregularis DAH-3]|uniref:U3 small nucleolar RNA-associated protein 25 n=1 Tax=Neolecta irregularis (strain DAH-3) TaxID=1198029 RepID=A0A1U7LIX6_NEOID|nr:U3 small nucleolar RNA-associated protein 25 [Neolecta irregularis DAH-3]|eukprot:OLL22578.1 U3 small nucleolar RNA-associated protein 25 [Neolecta irregularis DAH-3]